LNVLYGYISVTAKMPPKGFLYFPAIWMYNRLGWQPEIDIVELMGSESNEAWFTHHWVGEDGNDKSEGISKKFRVDLSKDFHEYSVEWTKDKLTWFIDRIPYYSTTNQIPQVELFLICNIQSDGNPPFTHLYTEDEVPQEMTIKKIEIYQK
jgi:beta-glucanase (GH16 family)